MPLPSQIAIDGPAASGKSTIAEILARDLGYLFFDTGLMYRAVTWAALRRKIDIGDEEQVSALANEVIIDVRPPSIVDGRKCDVILDGEDITWEVRSAEVEANVSPVSAYPRVRQAMTVQQRRIGQRGRVVMVGRDIGTVVLPEAELKIYLDASVEERARRRYLENLQRGCPADYNIILEAMRRRDRIDSTRAVAPLRAAPDAVRIDSDGLNVQQVYQIVHELVTGDC